MPMSQDRKHRRVGPPDPAEGFHVIAPDPCPLCGLPPERTVEYRGPICLPTTCDAWVTTATFNYDTREWDLVSAPKDVVDR